MTVRSINVVTGEEEAREYTPTEQAANAAAQAQELADAPYRAIAALEALETPRRLAEAALGDTVWLQANRDKIAAERLKL